MCPNEKPRISFAFKERSGVSYYWRWTKSRPRSSQDTSLITANFSGNFAIFLRLEVIKTRPYPSPFLASGAAGHLNYQHPIRESQGKIYPCQHDDRAEKSSRGSRTVSVIKKLRTLGGETKMPHKRNSLPTLTYFARKASHTPAAEDIAKVRQCVGKSARQVDDISRASFP